MTIKQLIKEYDNVDDANAAIRKIGVLVGQLENHLIDLQTIIDLYVKQLSK